MSEGTKKRRIYSDVFLLKYIPLFRTRMAGKWDEWGNWIRGKGRKREYLKRKFRGKESASDFAFAFLAFHPIGRKQCLLGEVDKLLFVDRKKSFSGVEIPPAVWYVLY